MKILSCHGSGRPGYHHNFWVREASHALPSKLGKVEHFIIDLDGRKQKDFVGHTYTLPEGDYDMIYIQMKKGAVPSKRPDTFIYTMLSDYIGAERRVKHFIKEARPNLLLCLQHWTKELSNYGKKYGCKVVLLPWFVMGKMPYIKDKTIEGMCTGVIHHTTYKDRKQVHDYLLNMNRDDIILSCSGNFGNYKLTNKEYENYITKTKYYFSGGIHNKLIPPKYYEICNAGACLVSKDMPEMKKCGFIDGKTFIKLNNMSDINKILDTDKYIEIGIAGQKMIEDKHTVDVRAKQIMDIYNAAT